MRCVECGYVSVRFDPFTFLSLPLPMDNSIYVEVIGESFVIKTQCIECMCPLLLLVMSECVSTVHYIWLIVYCAFCPM